MTAHLDGAIRDGRHHMQIRVYYEDTDFSGIVYHANYLRFMERGRTNHLRLMGAEQHALFAEAQAETPGFAFVVRSMQIDFLKPARMDDVLDVVTWPVAVKGASITLAQEVRRGEDVLVKAAGARRLHQRGPGAADPESAAGVDEGRSDLAIGAIGNRAIDFAVISARYSLAVHQKPRSSCRARRCRRSPERPPPRRPAWPKTPGIRAIPNASSLPIPRTAAGATAPNFSRAAPRSSRS